MSLVAAIPIFMKKTPQTYWGFDSSGLFTVDVRYESEFSLALHEQVIHRVRALPGITSVSATDLTPINAISPATVVSLANANTSASDVNSVECGVFDNYLSTMRIAVRLGRDFSATEIRASAPVAIISVALAHSLAPNENLLGKQIQLSRSGATRVATVVGVVDNICTWGYSAPAGPRRIPEARIYVQVHYGVLRGTNCRRRLRSFVKAQS